MSGKLTLPFKGVRAEVVSGSGRQYSAGVTIDAKLPSQTKECFIRSDEFLGMWDTNVGIINFNSPPGEQLWTVEMTSFTDKFTFAFKASGSVTGEEGSTVNGVLNGVHLKLDKDSFIWDYTPPVVGKKYTFSSILNGCDTYNGSKMTLFSGLQNKSHTLVLNANNPTEIPDITAIQIYDPTVQAVSNDPKPTIPQEPDRPNVYDMTDKSTKVSGYVFDPGVINITIGTTKYTTTPNASGDWSKTLPKTLKVGTKVVVIYTVKGVKSKPRVIFVKPSQPQVNKVTSKSKFVTGKTYAKAKVIIRIKNSTKSVIANSKGLFSIKLFALQKKGSSFMIKVTYLGQNSSDKTIKVY